MAVYNSSWANLFPGAVMVNAEHIKSDHIPLVLHMEYEVSPIVRSSGGLKSFEARWLREETIEDIIKTVWDRACMEPTFAARTLSVHAELHASDRSTLKAPKKRIEELKKDMESFRAGPLTYDSIFQLKEIQFTIESLLEQEEIYWIQRG
ncbi:uncharacterized protein LOC133910472 [Phragmites australis]|uniref:uncharacterized protein LOC133910472 n=1 Tax=Phragmites australis TaxID=29695 RepID=UPI002D77924A|nr:uncharacterized protein LOC133910472 [Phragmites australis]